MFYNHKSESKRAPTVLKNSLFQKTTGQCTTQKKNFSLPSFLRSFAVLICSCVKKKYLNPVWDTSIYFCRNFCRNGRYRKSKIDDGLSDEQDAYMKYFNFGTNFHIFFEALKLPNFFPNFNAILEHDKYVVLFHRKKLVTEHSNPVYFHFFLVKTIRKKFTENKIIVLHFILNIVFKQFVSLYINCFCLFVSIF